ncbi:bifunctional glycosyltransferase/CDP-glycerol:glycerophosphate glycerophosphotransferase [Streptomyces endophyticus]|uniref:Bifunctional glycosyltransferase family 2 protein/CDP-glycerol:glycerophosphate glycerophosphotransferase n=1 Tax=Streptomyces endophyticus TaxID=714166 RepID=A0ABU6EXW1_9ACTN|nr:bifunctional glycosyltransferase family 2 protein/CDP-glycerol:glycerophosphate glycerophosphotransferase [Streptomyces endophyticus]MEB8336532.1 bifunctional glycosyltransferase family 2 protein/CDP-glycerol:glycerophosphate glycerophosphotransferase [Streptomyces endophyticus]
MPRFSVIVPAYLVQAYLHACLDSVLGQSYTDLELIAVDDASPDACGEILDSYAARDPRVTVVHLPQNVGLGEARNAGLERASGDYVVFLDSDDTLTPGSLAAIADRVKDTGGPDVLIYDYARAHWDGSLVRNQHAQMLNESGPQPFALADRPSLMRLLMVVWNKAYRREFLADSGLTFHPGYYEDTAWTYPALMAADSVATLDRVCVHYRQRRQGNILSTVSTRHFDVFDQYDRVFAFLDAHPELNDQWRRVLFRRMIDHFCTIFTTRGRLPRGSRAAFLRRARSHYARYRTPGGPVRTPTRLRHGLVRLGAHRVYLVITGTRRVRVRALRHVRRAAHAARGAALQAHYLIQCRLPVKDDLAVFSAYWNRGYSCSPAAIESMVRDLVPSIRTAWIARPAHTHTVPTGTRRLTPGTFSYWTALARAKYLVNNVNFDRRLRKRPGQVLLQTHHGTPLKKMGLDLQEHPAAGGGMDFATLLTNVDKWDYSLSANRHSTLTWERVYPAGYTTLEYGNPRNDIFARATEADRDRTRELLGLASDATVILYAPTHRDYQRTQTPHLDLARLARHLGPSYVFLSRAHYLSTTAPYATDPHPRVIDVSDHHTVEELCLASDALVTDYSSLMFDYAALDRPIVLLTDDRMAYEAARGTYFDIRSFAPGPVAQSQDELLDILATGHWNGSRSARLRTAFRARFCPYDDGHATERVVRRVFLGEPSEPPAPRPVPSDLRHDTTDEVRPGRPLSLEP